ncbi:MAG: ABC transporter substrate-binding protein [Deltaproteobacteria bacterium]|nr:ABC transporter substrate-binding protein [Deltaproteobacteria bacterium]
MKIKNLKIYLGIFFFLFTLSPPIHAKNLKGKIQIGIIQWAESPASYSRTREGFIEGMKNLGYENGKNVQFDIQIAEGDRKNAQGIAKDFVRKKVDLICALGTIPSLAALEATKEIPIVYSIVGEPKATGIIESRLSSGKNITGVSMKIPIEKQLEMVQKGVPKLKRLGILYCLSTPQAIVTAEEANQAAKKLGLAPQTCSFHYDHLSQLPLVTENMSKGVDAIYIPTDPILTAKENLLKILEVTHRFRVPVIAVSDDAVELGALMALHCDFKEIGKQAAPMAVKILKGIRPTDIPSQMPLSHRLTVNLKMAKKLGITLNSQFLSLAHRVIE